MNDEGLERQLAEQLETLRLEAKKKRRVLFIVCSGVLGGLCIIAVCVSAKLQGMSPAETHGILPLVPFLLFAVITVVVGLIVEAAENRVHDVEWKIRGLHEVDG